MQAAGLRRCPESSAAGQKRGSGLWQLEEPREIDVVQPGAQQADLPAAPAPVEAGRRAGGLPRALREAAIQELQPVLCELARPLTQAARRSPRLAVFRAALQTR